MRRITTQRRKAPGASWGKGSGDSKPKRQLWPLFAKPWLTIGIVCLLAFMTPLAATADPGSNKGAGNDIKAFVPGDLLANAQANPNGTFKVIVQGTPKRSSEAVDGDVTATVQEDQAGEKSGAKRFHSISGVAVTLKGKQILRLAKRPYILAITPDAVVPVAGRGNAQRWAYVSGVTKAWADLSTSSLKAATIAVVDSGIDTTKAELAGRVIKQVTFCSLPNNSPGDGDGHGTFVASIAAGEGAGYAGAAPDANLVSIDVADDNGGALTSDVIAAADWIYQNKDIYGIRVANFSLHATNPASFLYDPLDKAVEKLWFSGVVVVAAAGNYNVNGLPNGVLYAPGNDPFVITVGAADVNRSLSTTDDFAAPWSAYGATLDGFSKPDLGAPGRFIVAPVPAGASLPVNRPTKVTAPGYIELSGTSFAAPIVAGTAAYVLAVHPTWTPDQVKGALMQTASPTPSAAPGALGIGEANATRAVAVTSPTNPNAALDAYVVADPTGGPTPVFDGTSWQTAAQASPTWDATASSALSASWTSASWTSASWTSASWTSASWTSASWTSASWMSASGLDMADEDPVLPDGDLASPADLAEAALTP